MAMKRTATVACRLAVCVCAVVAAGCDLSVRNVSVSRGLQSEDPSLRLTSAVKAANENDRSALPLLVERLEDDSPDVRMFAIEALRRMTGEDFGYRFYADEMDRAKAVKRWRKWLKAHAPAQTGD